MSGVSKYAFRTTLFQRFRGFTQCATSVDHVIDNHTVTAFNITDQVHDF
ncbi:Uncharacterised protein [Vibrio cholerae]|nr:Uncharacterised protein [Vibrio cholerae]